MDVYALKMAFALALSTVPGNPFLAAQTVFPNDFNMACKYAVEWNSDPEVIKRLTILTDIKENPTIDIKDAVDLPDDNYVLPLIATKDEAAQAAWNIANDSMELGKDRVAALKLFAEINNYMPDKTINKNVNIGEVKANRVMAYKDHGTDEEWEAKALLQQKVMING